MTSKKGLVPLTDPVLNGVQLRNTLMESLNGPRKCKAGSVLVIPIINTERDNESTWIKKLITNVMVFILSLLIVFVPVPAKIVDSTGAS